MPDLSDRRGLTIALVVANLAARGWAAAGVGMMFALTGLDLVGALAPAGDMAVDEVESLGSVALFATAVFYFALPGVVSAVGLALVRRFLFPRVVWGNAHWIFPALAGMVGLAVGVVLGAGVV